MSHPESWTLAPLQSVTLTVDKRDPVETGRQAVHYVDIGSIDGARHRIDEVSWVEVAAAPSRCRQVLRAGDTVFSTVRPYLEKVAYIDDSLDGEFASTGFCVLRPSADVLPKYLFHFVSSRGLLDQVLPLQRGVSYPAVLDKQVRACSIPYPGIEEQRRVVDILEDHLSRLDAAEAGLQLCTARLKSLRLTVLHRGITGPLRRLGDLAIDAGYGTSIKCKPAGPGIPVARIPNLINSKLDMSQEKRASDPTVDLSGLLLQKGDLLIIRTNGSRDLIGRSAVVTADMQVAFASYIIRYRLSPDEVMSEWAHLALESPKVRAELESLAASSAGQLNLGLKKLDRLLIPCPDVGTQGCVLTQIQKLEDDRRRLAAAVGKQSDRVAALRRALLAAAFSGKLTGRHTDHEVIEELSHAQ